MNATDLAAWVGAVTGVCTIAWDIYKWVTSGPKLAVQVRKGMVLVPDPQSEENRYVQISVQNNGTAATTITTCSFSLYDS
jgi:hypothetical protein